VSRKFLGRGSKDGIRYHFHSHVLILSLLGYKVGRVDQAETALGAEMRVAADKSQGKKSNKDGEKIVRR
jgi:hypothetical protein